MPKLPSLRLPTHSLPSATSWLKVKKSLRISGFVTEEGHTLPDFDLGYEVYGELNVERSNTILVCHYFSGSSNAAGRYSETDPEPGYWDSIIGPQKSIDTEKYCVVAIDILCNACPSLPSIHTIGPFTVNEKTQKPFGMSFPKISIRDMVRAQKLVLEFLGISSLHAVAGASLGSMQAWQWAADYPAWVPRIMTVIGSGFETHTYVSSAVELWARMLKLDPEWKEGSYTSSDFPTKGMVSGLEMLTWNCLSPQWTEAYGFGALHTLASQRAGFIDPNHFLYIIQAVQGFSVRSDLEKVKARALVVAAASDLLMLPQFSKEAVDECRKKGIQAEYLEIPGEGGHLDGLFAIEKIEKEIKEFINS